MEKLPQEVQRVRNGQRGFGGDAQEGRKGLRRVQRSGFRRKDVAHRRAPHDAVGHSRPLIKEFCMRYFHKALIVCFAVAAIGAVAPARASQDVPKAATTEDLSGVHDFDFLVGKWQVHSRKLKERLTGSHDWEEYDGTIRSFPLMGGLCNVDDTEFDMPQ